MRCIPCDIKTQAKGEVAGCGVSHATSLRADIRGEYDAVLEVVIGDVSSDGKSSECNMILSLDEMARGSATVYHNSPKT